MKPAFQILIGLLILSLFSFNKSEFKFTDRIPQTQDTTKFYHQVKFQKWVDDFEKGKIFKFKDEEKTENDILDTKEKAQHFAEQIILSKIPKLKDCKVKYVIGEDRTSKLWFVCASYPQAAFGGEVYLIFFKGNCKVLWFYKTS